MPPLQAVSLDLFNTIVHLEPDRDVLQFNLLDDRGIGYERDAIRRAIVAMDGRNDARRFSTPGAADGAAWAAWERDLLVEAGVEVDIETAGELVQVGLAVQQRYALFADVVPLLDVLRQRGVATAIISNIPMTLAEFAPGLGLDTLADVSITSHEVGASKPDPAIFAAAANRLGCAPSAALHVGDQLEGDVMGARRAGFRGVLLDRHGLWANVPVERIASLEAVADYL